MYRSADWQQHQRQLTAACKAIMAGVVRDKRIMPVRRYREARRAFSVYMKHTAFCEAKHVLAYKALLKQCRRRWNTSVRAVTKACGVDFFGHSRLWKGKQYVHLLDVVQIGMLNVDGSIRSPANVDPSWDTKGIFMW